MYKYSLTFILFFASFPIFSEVMLKKIVDVNSYIDTGIRFEKMSDCFLVLTQNKMLLEKEDLHENFEINKGLRKDNKSKFDQFECKEINNAKTEN